MNDFFIDITFLDIIDILLFAYILYKIYLVIRGSIAINIFIGISIIYFFWLAVRAFKMELLSTLLSQIMSIGLIALIIVFQQEIRRFLVIIGSRYFTTNYRFKIINLFKRKQEDKPQLKISSILKAIENLSNKQLGALIVIAHKMSLDSFSETGDQLNADISSRLIEGIFNKESPLHDGAIIINNNKIVAARCILPITDKTNLPAHYGTRHRAALGMAEYTDAFIIVVSEETGNISLAYNGYIHYNITTNDIKNILNNYYFFV